MRTELCKLSDITAKGSGVLPVFGREIHLWRDSGGRLSGPGPTDARLMFLSTSATDDALFHAGGE